MFVNKEISEKGRDGKEEYSDCNLPQGRQKGRLEGSFLSLGHFQRGAVSWVGIFVLSILSLCSADVHLFPHMLIFAYVTYPFFETFL